MKMKRDASLGRKFNLKIDFPDDAEFPPIMAVGKILTELQTLVYHIGDSLVGSDFRLRGSPPAPIKKRCNLVFQRVSLGSFAAELMVEDTQSKLDAPPLGVSAITLLHDVSEKIEEGKDAEEYINGVFPDPRHRARIIADFGKIWPRTEDNYEVDLHFPNKVPVVLTRGRRVIVDGLLSRPEMQQKASIEGVLAGIEVAPKNKKEIKVIGPDGTIRCTMAREYEVWAKRFLHRPVRVYGDAEFDEAGDISEFVNVTRIEPFNQLQLKRIYYKDDELTLKKPVEVAVDYIRKDDLWSMENEDLGIISMAESYDACLTEFYSDFLFVWRTYGQADSEKLSREARELKNLIESLVGGDKR